MNRQPTLGIPKRRPVRVVPVTKEQRLARRLEDLETELYNLLGDDPSPEQEQRPRVIQIREEIERLTNLHVKRFTKRGHRRHNVKMEDAPCDG